METLMLLVFGWLVENKGLVFFCICFALFMNWIESWIRGIVRDEVEAQLEDQRDYYEEE